MSNNYSVRGKSKEEWIPSYQSVYCYRLGWFDKAIECVEELITQGEDDYIDIYNLAVFHLAKGDKAGLSFFAKAMEQDTTGFVEAVYNTLQDIKQDSLVSAEMYLKQDIPSLKRSGIAMGLHAWVLESLGNTQKANVYWIRCYSLLPLGLDVDSMRKFITQFINNYKTEGNKIK